VQQRSRRDRCCTSDFLERIGVAELPPATCPFDPGYDPVTLDSHLEQSAHLISMLKVSMACWLVAGEAATRRKVTAARRREVPTVTGGGPFEIAVAQGELDAYLDLCADIGFDRIECATGFAAEGVDAHRVVAAAEARGLEVQFELGRKHDGPFTPAVVAELLDQGRVWLDAGARQLVVEARESAAAVGLFDLGGRLDHSLADASPTRSGST
jgi:phosphosulfolactate synthase